MLGVGLIKGLKVTAGNLFGKAITEQYPERKPNLPPRSHGSFWFEPEKCNACGVCANSCPNNVITVTSERDENKKRYLTRYQMDLGYCLFCGLCVESCPNEGLHIDNNFELSSYRRQDIVQVLYEKEPQQQVVNE